MAQQWHNSSASGHCRERQGREELRQANAKKSPNATSAAAQSLNITTPNDFIDFNRGLVAQVERTISQHVYPWRSGLADSIHLDDCEENFWVLSSKAVAAIDEEISIKQSWEDETETIVINLLASNFVSNGATASQGDTTTPSANRTAPVPSSFKSSSSEGSRKRKDRRRQDVESEDDNSESEEEARPSKLSRSERPTDKRFACPYFKKNPREYAGERTCMGPGWKSINRLKEHIYRRHRLPRFKCNRCGKTFANLVLQATHERSPMPCKVADWDDSEGVNLEQETRLKSRKGISQMTESERWKEIYMILFPDEDPSKIPSPYHEPIESLSSSDLPETNCAQAFARYEAFLREELPVSIRNEIEEKIEIDFLTDPEDLKRKVIELVRSVQEKIFRSFLDRERGLKRLQAAQTREIQPPSPSFQNERPGNLMLSIGKPPYDLDILERSVLEYDPNPEDLSFLYDLPPTDLENLFLGTKPSYHSVTAPPNANLVPLGEHINTNNQNLIPSSLFLGDKTAVSVVWTDFGPSGDLFENNVNIFDTS
ncbi:hypothetical protein F5Y16DRAFT_400880 [Xylariaceae sp. FL0255]|nr:hypothetical protein F5Y16DRAFT_400880 [Xylariaceae sp. FL0255]